MCFNFIFFTILKSAVKFNYFRKSSENFLIKNSGLFSSNALCKINYNLDTLLLSSYIENSVVILKSKSVAIILKSILSIDLPIQQKFQ